LGEKEYIKVEGMLYELLRREHVMINEDTGVIWGTPLLLITE
jgi:hypothetical protein